MEEFIQVSQVGGVFEDPAPFGCGRLDQGQGSAMPGVDRGNVLGTEPFSVAGEVGHGVEGVVDEVVSEEMSAFFWPLGTHIVKGAKAGVQGIDGCQFTTCCFEPGVAP